MSFLYSPIVSRVYLEKSLILLAPIAIIGSASIG